MKLKTIAFLTLAAACAFTVSAQYSRRRGAVGADGGKAVAQGRDAYVTIDVPARPGGTCLASAPNLQANGKLLPPLGGRPRQWIVLETKYTTMAKWQDELTFTWHVLLDSSKAKEKDPRNLPAPYSYYTTQVRYVDIKKGSHMASVCLPPSVLERYGEPCTVSLIITNKDGDQLAAQTENQDKNAASAMQGENGKWWENDKFMNWQRTVNGEQKNQVERRQGLVDRSKTPFWLVNNADYELVQ
ncbi:MAG: hypothetical protein IKL96_03095 [Kiritimatiellae bacterium]|nr:hypothetical protein [Kiritimatiellia bacterium]